MEYAADFYFGGYGVMVSNEGREYCRDIGLWAENIICMTDCYNEPIEVFRKDTLYRPEFEDKEMIVRDMQDTAKKMAERVKLISIADLQNLHNEYGVSIIEYIDMVSSVLRKEPYDNNEVKFKADAVVSLVLDIVHREMRTDVIYKQIAEGVIHENV